MKCKTEYLNETFGTIEALKNKTFLNFSVSYEKDAINKINKRNYCYNQKHSKAKSSKTSSLISGQCDQKYSKGKIQ